MEVHHSVELIFSTHDGLGRNSLTSKYLHFHRPDRFPIYDSRMAKAIAQVAPDSRFTGYELSSEHAAFTYGKYASRAAWLVKRMEEISGITPTLRQLDKLFLEVHRVRIKGQKRK